MARKHDVPRGRIIKDDAIYEICGNPPKSLQDLSEMRGLSRGFDKNRYGSALLAEVRKTLEIPKSDLPHLPRPKQQPEGSGAATEMLKVLLKLTVETHGVAAKVIATVDELEKIAADDSADVPALKGWRRDLFGHKALKLKNGQLAIGFNNNAIKLIELDASDIGQVHQAAAE